MTEGAAGDTGRERQEERTVLIVDDDHATRLLLRAAVEGLSIPCRIHEVGSGDEAIASSRRARPDLALVDIVLPGSGASGVMVCKELCRDSRTKVVIVSGQASDSIVHAALAAGAVEYIRKPFSVDDLQSRLARWLVD